MKNNNDPACGLLAQKILEAETKLEQLKAQIDEIGQPAAHELQRRLDMLRIEEKALKRNFEESVARGEPDTSRIEKIEALLHHIEAEEFSIERDSKFLGQAAPSSVIIVAETGAKVVDAIESTVKRVIGDHNLLGSSVFVNHSHDTLVERYGLEESEGEETKDKGLPFEG